MYRSGGIFMNVFNSSFVSNSGSEGGGLYLVDGSSKFANVSMVSNYGVTYGGGLRVSDNESLVMASSSLEWNSAGESGGGAYLGNEVEVQASDTLYSENIAYGSSGGGGAVYVMGDSILSSVGDSYHGNEAKQGSGGGVYVGGLSRLTCSSCVLQNNTAFIHGGGLYTESWDVSLEESSMVLNNVAETGDGGGLYSSSSTKLVLSDVIFEANTALDIEGSSVYGRGGAIAFSMATNFNLENVVIRQNEAVYGGGVYSPMNASVTLQNIVLEPLQITVW